MKSLHTRMVKKLKNNRLSLEDLAERLSTDIDKVEEELQYLRDSHIPVDVMTSQEGETLYFIPVEPQVGNVFHISGNPRENWTLHAGFTSDWHFASVFHLPKSWHESMQRTVDAGITHVYVAGDLMDGVHIYRGHLENLVTPSIEGQTDMVAEAISRFPELHFLGIAGNHDYAFTKQNGAKPLSILEAKVDNFTNLGDVRADVIYNGIRIRLLHGGGGRSYARSYPTQTYLRDYFGGLEREELPNVPHIMIVGHYHTVYFSKDHGVYVMQPGSFQDSDNEYCARRGLTGPVGLFHVTAEVDKDGVIHDFTPKYVKPSIAAEEKGRAFAKTTKKYKRRKGR